MLLGKVGHLYPSGDYAEASRLIRQLIEDPAARKAMQEAGRAEVEKFGWSAATKVLREQQYIRAIRVNSFKQRCVAMRARGCIRRISGAFSRSVSLCFPVLSTGLGSWQSGSELRGY